MEFVDKDSFYNCSESFLKEVLSLVQDKGLDLSSNELDHLCYRVSTVEEYESYKKLFEGFSTLLIESPVGGRRIATYKLIEPVKIDNREIFLVELPEPKKGSHYLTGFEHVEFVISESFEDFSSKYDLEFNWKGASKEINPELCLKLSEKYSIKLHHQTLESVIELELSSQK